MKRTSANDPEGLSAGRRSGALGIVQNLDDVGRHLESRIFNQTLQRVLLAEIK